MHQLVILKRLNEAVVFSKMSITTNKRIYDEAFVRKKLQSVELNDFYIEHTVYKVLKRATPLTYLIQTSENSKFSYGESIILETATSATLYTSERKATKTELIELFSSLSLIDIWFVMYYTQDKDNTWHERIVEKIQSMDKNDAMKFVKNDFTTFGKTMRELVGQKIHLKSDNNYYTVRDLNMHFEELTNTVPTIASKRSIRKLDVNALQCLIFNGVKYSLK